MRVKFFLFGIIINSCFSSPLPDALSFLTHPKGPDLISSSLQANTKLLSDGTKSFGLTRAVSLSSLQPLELNESCVINGQGQTIAFEDLKSPSLIVKPGCVVSFCNVIFSNFAFEAIAAAGASIIFTNDVVIKLTAQTTLESGDWFFGDQVSILGAGNRIVFSGRSGIILPNSTVRLFDSDLILNAGSQGFVCTDDSGVLLLEKIIFHLSGAVVVSKGSIIIRQSCAFEGVGHSMTYQSNEKLFVESATKLKIGRGVTFSYEPKNASDSLFVFCDRSSSLILDQGILAIKKSLRLTRGMLETRQDSFLDLTTGSTLFMGDGALAESDFGLHLTAGVFDIRGGMVCYQNVK